MRGRSLIAEWNHRHIVDGGPSVRIRSTRYVVLPLSFNEIPMRRLISILLVAVSLPAAAQRAVTITGHVSSGNAPLQGASVRIEQLDMTTTTNADGRYSLIVPSSRVQGQTVTLTARYLRYAP